MRRTWRDRNKRSNGITKRINQEFSDLILGMSSAVSLFHEVMPSIFRTVFVKRLYISISLLGLLWIFTTILSLFFDFFAENKILIKYLGIIMLASNIFGLMVVQVLEKTKFFYFIENNLLIRLSEKFNSSSKNKDNALALKLASISSQYFADQRRKTITSIVNSIMVLSLSIILKMTEWNGFVSNILLAAVSFWVVLVVLNYVTLSYRMRNGYFGCTESEARDLLRFIVENQDKFGPDDGHTKIFDASDNKNKEIFVFGSEAEA